MNNELEHYVFTIEKMASKIPPIVLFGYDSSPFTNKVRITLKMMQIPYTFVLVPSMMPRPVLVENFGLTYRKIPVLAMGREILADTSLIVEWLHTHPQLKAFRLSNRTDGGRSREIYENDRNRVLTRLLGSYYTDRPFFRTTTGTIPGVVWRTSFGKDREELIGHPLDAKKLEAKVPRNLIELDTHLSLLEPLFKEAVGEKDGKGGWILGGDAPSAADINLWYQLDWSEKISRGEGIEDLTGRGTDDRSGAGKGISQVFSRSRYPGVWSWFYRFKEHMDGLPLTETRVGRSDREGLQKVISQLENSETIEEVPLLSTPNTKLSEVEDRVGLKIGGRVSVRPSDTGMANPTLGILLAISPEEIVIKPDVSSGNIRVKDARLHFPRVGFVVAPLQESKL